MSLQRKENNLRRAQARFDRIQNPPRWKVVSHLKAREFQIDYRREPNRHGRYRTRAYIVRGAKAYHGNNRGLIHKAVNLKYRVQGDKPSVTRTLKSWQPKTVRGKLFKANARAVNFAVHDVTQTTVDTALAAETVGLKTSDTAQREVRNKLKQKYTREAVDDYHRGVFFVGRAAVDAVKGTHQHLKTKKQYKLEKAKLQLKKADNKLYKAKTGKPKLKANKADLKRAKAEYKAKKKPAHGNKLRKAMNKRRLQAYKQTKCELKFERKQLKTENKFRVKEYRNQKKIAKLSKPGLLILKPAKYTAGRMRASAWQKAVNEDQDNDFLHAIDSAKRRIVEPAAQKVSKPQRLQKQEKKRDSLSDKKSKSDKRLNKHDTKLKEKHDKYKQKKKKHKPKKPAKKSISETFKSAFKFVKNVYEKEVKKYFGAIAVPIIIILLVFAFIIMIFSSVSSGGGFTLGTYAAQDYDISEAEKYYTELAYNLNQKILKVSDTSDWKKGLTDFGAKKKDLKDTPDNWYWGKSSVYDWDPVYDFDTYKLWAFLCAYYYDFDADDNGDIKYWKFKSDTKTLLEEIFNNEYEFVYWYDNKSRWENLDNYVYFGGGNSTNGSYYYCEQSANKGSGDWTYQFKPTSYTSELGQYLDGDGYCYLNGSYRVLNPNDDYALTGYYVLDNRYFADSAHTKEPFYWIDGDGNFFFRNHDGNNQYRSFYGWTGDDAWFMITETDARAWTGDNDCSALFGYVQKQYWKTECNLYYNVKQKKTFDEVIADKLGGMSHKTERLAYYDLLVGKEDGTGALYGNHQTIHNLLSGDTIRDYSLKREFGYEMTGWNEDSDGLYQGIKVYASSGSVLTAPFDCKITDVDTTDNKITIRKDDVEYWYDGTGGTKRDTEIEIANAKLTGSYKKGDTLKEGDEFAKTTAGNVNFHIYIDTDGYGWDYIDPRLVLY